MSTKQLAKLYLIIFIAILIIFSFLTFILFFLNQDISFTNLISKYLNAIDYRFFLFTIVGFIAQMIDGTLGMGYGISSTSFLLSFGISPASASASVHTAKIFTSGISGFSHWIFKNVNKKLLILIIIPGIFGAILGSLLLAYLDSNQLKPYIAAYLLFMGLRIIYKAYAKNSRKIKFNQYSLLGFIGGFVDSSGGGWGPIVTSTLIGVGRNPTITIGTVNAAEFIIALVTSLVFAFLLQFSYWQIILGLIIGGIIAAPLAAYFCHKIKTKLALVLVGLIIVMLSSRTLFLSLF